MTFRVELTARAERDLASIYAYIQAGSSASARGWFNGLERSILSLESQPERGVLVEGHRAVRQILYGIKPHRYRILYSVQKRSALVTVLHIRHGARRKTSATKPWV